MKKIRFLAVALAVVLVAGSAFKTMTTQTYRVTGTDGSNYIVATISGTYRCTASSNPCTVDADPADVSAGEVAMSKTSNLVLGDFKQP